MMRRNTAVALSVKGMMVAAKTMAPALDRNIELGLLVRDRVLAASVSSHFRVLIDQTLLCPLPMA